MKSKYYGDDLEKTLQTFLVVSIVFSQQPKRSRYFLATCRYFSQPEIFYFGIALKLCANGGLSAIGNFSWEKYLNNSNILRLHAVLHDAGCFIQELYNVGTGYLLMLPCKLHSFFDVNMTLTLICL